MVNLEKQEQRRYEESPSFTLNIENDDEGNSKAIPEVHHEDSSFASLADRFPKKWTSLLITTANTQVWVDGIIYIYVQLLRLFPRIKPSLLLILMLSIFFGAHGAEADDNINIIDRKLFVKGEFSFELKDSEIMPQFHYPGEPAPLALRAIGERDGMLVKINNVTGDKLHIYFRNGESLLVHFRQDPDPELKHPSPSPVCVCTPVLNCTCQNDSGWKAMGIFGICILVTCTCMFILAVVFVYWHKYIRVNGDRSATVPAAGPVSEPLIGDEAADSGLNTSETLNRSRSVELNLRDDLQIQ